MKDQHTLHEIFKHFGSRSILAELMGCSPQALTNWSRRGVPPHAAIKIERLSEGHFKAVNMPIYEPDVAA